jgi:hypothetical protein
MPNLEDFNGVPANPIGNEVVLMDHKLADVGKFARPAREWILGEALSPLPDRLEQRARGPGVVVCDVGSDAIKIAERAA